VLDSKFIRENLPLLKTALQNRGSWVNLEELLEVDATWREINNRVQELKHRQNRVSEEISRLKREGRPLDSKLEDMKKVKAQIAALEQEQTKLEECRRDLLLGLPNIPHGSVPVGKDANDNKEVRRWGEPPHLTFKPRPHWEIGEDLGILDFERAVRMTGTRFTLYRGLGARLERALINFMLDLHTREHGYIEVLTPFMVNRASMVGTGQLPKFEEDLFRLKDEDYFLIPTAEVSVTNIHREEILAGHKLPLSYAAYSPCFRREAGSYGKDVRGLIRQHQFNKVELVKFTRREESYEQLERLLSDAEEVLKRLKIHYRVMELCTGDLGFAAAKTYDMEVWLPGEGTYREISSCSNFEDFQARRCMIRYRPMGGKKPEYVHTLNGSGLAIGRTVVAILENYQQEDGSVVIPEVLRPYMDGVERITPKEY
jgi:seryl-tRNA synthetase